jgi:hypothetical protein
MFDEKIIEYNDGKVRYKDIIIADKGFVLNLPDRTDRRDYVLNTLNELNISGWEFEDGVRFDDPEWRRYGCTQAYINMFKKAIDNDYESIIVFEDDIKKTGMISLEQIDEIFKQWPIQSKKYNLIALGTRPFWESKITKDSENFGTLSNCLCTQSFYFNREFINYAYETLSCYNDPTCSHFRVVIDEFISDCCSHEQICKIPNKIFKVGITIPMMFTQSYGYSDNEQTFMNYEGWIEDSYWSALKNGETK